jgi:hypothetical protein
MKACLHFSQLFCSVRIQGARHVFQRAHQTQARVIIAAIQRRCSTLSWIVILSVYGAVTIAIDLSLSALNLDL